jgi:hypothetical protein
VKDHLAWVQYGPPPAFTPKEAAQQRALEQGWILVSGRGLVVVNQLWFTQRAPPADVDWAFTWETPPAASWQRPSGGVLRTIGFDYSDTGAGAPGWRGGFVPHWFLAAVFVSPALARFLTGTARKRRRLARGLCPACGYDLTGNVSGVCPECGADAGARTRSGKR